MRSTLRLGSRRPPASSALLAALTLVAALTLGCVAIRPLDEARAGLAPGALLEVAGQRVHVDQAGSGEPLVLLHGFGESTYTFRHLLPALAERHRVIAVDLNGFGYTDRPHDLAAYTLDGQATLVLAVLDRLGVERAHFVGHSYGGALTLWLAAHHPERLRSMALVDTAMPRFSTDRRHPAAGIRPFGYLLLRGFALRDGPVRRALQRAYHDDALATPEVVRATVDRLRVTGIARAYRGLTASNGEPPATIDLAALDLPTLVVWGREDTITPLRNGRRIAAALPQARLVILPDCGHVPMEERPRELLAALLPFLAEHAVEDGAGRDTSVPAVAH